MKILLLEDDCNLAESIKEILEMENYKVDIANTAEEAYQLSYENKYDLYIFDINIPDENGIKVLKNLRFADDNTPTIYISALVDINTIAQAFDAGAEDYIKKPFEVEELLIRIKAKRKNNSILTYNNILIDTNEEIVKQNNSIVKLGSVQYNILLTLLKNKGKIVPKEELMNSLEHPNENALRVTINKLKNKLNIDIKSIRSKGYLIE
jgi:DNA-binding response OmpR family regulator